MDDYAIRFGAAVAAELRAERAAAGITIAALASDAGIPEVTLRRYLKNTRDLPLPALVALSFALGVNPAIILTRAQERAEQR